MTVSKSQTKFNGKSMKFQKGHKLAKGGAREGAGRKSKQVKADEARAAEIAKEILARGLGEVLATLKKVAMGVKRKKFYPAHYFEWLLTNNPKAKKFYYEIEYDAASIRFWIDRFVPPARQGSISTLILPRSFIARWLPPGRHPNRDHPLRPRRYPSPRTRGFIDGGKLAMG